MSSQNDNHFTVVRYVDHFNNPIVQEVSKKSSASVGCQYLRCASAAQLLFVEKYCTVPSRSEYNDRRRHGHRQSCTSTTPIAA
jgi:hypothetical protein